MRAIQARSGGPTKRKTLWMISGGSSVRRTMLIYHAAGTDSGQNGLPGWVRDENYPVWSWQVKERDMRGYAYILS